MKTFEEFKKEWQAIEELEGVRLQVSQGQISTRGPLTDEELLEMYNATQEKVATGVEDHGQIIGGPGVLTLKDTGK